MTSDASLEQAERTIRDRCRAAGVDVYPYSVVLSESALTAPWPDDDEGAFASFAVSAGARVLYLRAKRVDDDLAAAWVAELGPDDPLLAELGAHSDELMFVDAAWVLEGVVHYWTRRSDWWGDWLERAERRADEVVDELEAESAAHDRARIAELAEHVAAERSFRRAGQHQRRAVCLQHIEFAVDRPRAVVDDVTAAAAAIIDADAGPRARELRAAGKSKKSIVAALDITESMLERYLAEDA